MNTEVYVRMSKPYILERGAWEREKPEQVGAFGFRINYSIAAPERITKEPRYRVIAEFGGFNEGQFYPVREFEVGWKTEEGKISWLVTPHQRRFLYVRFYDSYMEGLFSIEDEAVHPMIANSLLNEVLSDYDLERRYAQEFACYLQLPPAIALCRMIFGMTDRPEGGHDFDAWTRHPYQPTRKD